jgi:Flp pilus assembly protein TadG
MMGLLRKLWRHSGGNVMLMAGFALVPLIFSIGFGIDYSRAQRLQTIVNAAADSAALSAVSNNAMAGTAAQAQANAIAMFKAQVTGLTGLVFNSGTDVTVTITTSTTSTGIGRKVVLAWRAKSTNIFSSILGSTALAITGSSTAEATKPPYVNYYLLLDTSPSMLLPTTSTGISALRSATSATADSPYGCAFACHTKNPHSDSIYIRNTSGQDIWLDSSGNAWAVSKTQNGYIYSSSYRGGAQPVAAASTGQYADGYWLTRHYSSLYGGSVSIPLRVDAETEAAQDLIATAQSYATSNKVTYKMQLYGFDFTNSGESSPLAALTSSLADVSTMSSSSVPDLYAAQWNWYSNNCPSSSFCNSDRGTEVANALSSINAIMPTPGDGSTASTPQEVLLIVTDGVADELYSGNRWVGEFNAGDLAQCTAIKNKGIQIGVLYTTYSASVITGNAWSMSVLNPRLPYVSSALQSCASTTASGQVMYFEVGTDGDISAALTALFMMTLQTARLVK